ISTDPFFDMFGLANVQFERRISPFFTLGLSGATNGNDTASLTLNARFYPQGRALDGFYAGLYGGTITQNARTGAQPGVGLELGYQWLLGPKQNIGVNLGFGVSRIVASTPRYEETLPRMNIINIGLVF